MNDAETNDFGILDCTIRDGGYINNWSFDKKLVREVYRALSKSGVDYVEIGYKGTDKYFDREKYGLWRFSPEEDIRDVTANITGAKLAIMADYGKIELEDFPERKYSVIELVRIAVNKDNLLDAVRLLEDIKKKGYKVSLNAMGYTNYSEEERNKFTALIKASCLDYVYIADSYGSLFPDQIKDIFDPLLSTAKVKIGFHPHNNLQMAFANTIEAIRCGVHIIDCTVYGMGRAAGNVPTEIIISFLERKTRDRYNSIPILNLIDRFFVSLENENKWGYQLPYMLSGMFMCHPNYAKLLVDSKEYTIEEIWKALEYVAKSKPVGFSKPLLKKLINDGIIIGSGNGQNAPIMASSAQKNSITTTKSYQNVPYIDRHNGRDFLILANGPTLETYKDKIYKFIEKYDPVILGANYIGKLFRPHYHAFNNKRRFASYCDTVSPESQLLIGQYIPDKMIREYTDRDYERIYYDDVLDSDFAIDKGIISTNCRTISILLLGLAIVMGANCVFAAGMDGYKVDDSVHTLHFYNEKDEKEDQDMILERHQWCQRFLEQIDVYLHDRNREGIHILTPTSYKTFYKGIENYI